jgi:hypothetical protein
MLYAHLTIAELYFWVRENSWDGWLSRVLGRYIQPVPVGQAKFACGLFVFVTVEAWFFYHIVRLTLEFLQHANIPENAVTGFFQRVSATCQHTTL